MRRHLCILLLISVVGLTFGACGVSQSTTERTRRSTTTVAPSSTTSTTEPVPSTSPTQPPTSVPPPQPAPGPTLRPTTTEPERPTPTDPTPPTTGELPKLRADLARQVFLNRSDLPGWAQQGEPELSGYSPKVCDGHNVATRPTSASVLTYQRGNGQLAQLVIAFDGAAEAARFFGELEAGIKVCPYTLARGVRTTVKPLDHVGERALRVDAVDAKPQTGTAPRVGPVSMVIVVQRSFVWVLFVEERNGHAERLLVPTQAIRRVEARIAAAR